MDRRIESDSEFEGRIRPQELEQFSGQEKIVENLRVFIKAALMRGDSLDHTLLHGPPGLGKTTLANIIANEMGAQLKVLETLMRLVHTLSIGRLQSLRNSPLYRRYCIQV